MKKRFLYAVFMLLPIAASAQQYIKVDNIWSADSKKLTVIISNTSNQPMFIQNDLNWEPGTGVRSYFYLYFQKLNGTELGNYVFLYRLKPLDQIKHIVTIPPKSSIKCEDYSVSFWAGASVKNPSEIKRIKLEHRIKYEIPMLNYQNVYTNTSEIVQGNGRTISYE